MPKLDISLDVYKRLTNLLRHDDDSYDSLLRELLDMDSVVEPEQNENSPFQIAIGDFAEVVGSTPLLKLSKGPGFVSRSLHLPEGSKLRARYKGKRFFAEIKGERWLGDDGIEHTSPSAAAHAITGTNVNGLRFWEVCMPRDGFWRRLDTVR